jgi:hypothetical protein
LCARIAAAVLRKRRDVICEVRGTRLLYVIPSCKTYPYQKSQSTFDWIYVVKPETTTQNVGKRVRMDNWQCNWVLTVDLQTTKEGICNWVVVGSTMTNRRMTVYWQNLTFALQNLRTGLCLHSSGMRFTKDTSKHWTDVNIPTKPHCIAGARHRGVRSPHYHSNHQAWNRLHLSAASSFIMPFAMHGTWRYIAVLQ